MPSSQPFKTSTTQPQLRHPAKTPTLRIRRLNHGPVPSAEPLEDYYDEHQRHDCHDCHEAPRCEADLAVAEVVRQPGAGGRREDLELVAPEGVVDQSEEGDGVADELEQGDLLGAEDNRKGDEEDGL